VRSSLFWIILVASVLLGACAAEAGTALPASPTTTTTTTTDADVVLITATCANNEPIEVVGVTLVGESREMNATIATYNPGTPSTGTFSFTLPKVGQRYNVATYCGASGGGVKFRSQTTSPVKGSVRLTCTPRKPNTDPKSYGKCVVLV